MCTAGVSAGGGWRVVVVWAGALLAGGCVEADATADGELRQGRFGHVCVGDGDAACDDGLPPEVFPEVFAVGARLDATYLPDDGDRLPLPRVQPGSTSSLRAGGGAGWIAARPGWAVWLAIDANDVVVDLRHVLLAKVDAIAVASEEVDDLARVALAPGDRLALRAAPQDGVGRALGGSLTYAWRLEGQGVAQIVSVAERRAIVLEALEPGTAVLRVTAGGVTRALDVIVDEPQHGGED